jgi:hypothetical protein
MLFQRRTSSRFRHFGVETSVERRACGLLSRSVMRGNGTPICLWYGTHSLSCAGGAVGVLRDNVEHFLEGGKQSERFRQLHLLADIPWSSGITALEPNELRLELLMAWDGVWRVPTRDIIVSLQTRTLFGAGHAFGRQGVAAWLCRSVGFAPMNTLGELIANLVHELSFIAAMAARRGPREFVQCAAPHAADPAALLDARYVSLGPSGPFLA